MSLILLALPVAQAAPTQVLTRAGVTAEYTPTRPAANGWFRAGQLIFRRPGQVPVTVETTRLVGAVLSELRPDGEQLAVMHGGYVQLWDTRSGTRQFSLLAADPRSYLTGRAAYSPDGSRLVMYAHPYELSLWDTRTGKRLRALHPPMTLTWGSAVVDVQFTPDGVVFVVVGGTGQATLFRTGDGSPLRILAAPRMPFMETTVPRGSVAAAFSGDGRQVAVLHAGGKARLYDVRTGRVLGAAQVEDAQASVSRHWTGTLTLKGRTLKGRTPNGVTFTMVFR